MSYPGNTSLSAEVQQRILRSFQQTVDLVSRGNESEAQLGCEFILGMDPLFRPATLLRDRLKATERPITVKDLFAIDPGAAVQNDDQKIVTADDLWTAPAAPAAPAPAPASGSGSGSGSGDDFAMADAPMGESSDTFASLPELDSLTDDGGIVLGDPASAGGGLDLAATRPTTIATPATPQAPETASAAAPAAAAGGLGVVLKDLIARGQHEQVLQIAANQRSAVEADPQLAAMVTEAQTRIETSQYVRSFIDAARRAQAEGKLDEADKLIAKARILDPENPELATLSQAARASQAPPPNAPAASPMPAAAVPATPAPLAPVPAAPAQPASPMAPAMATGPVDDAPLLSLEEDDNALPGLLRDDSADLDLAALPAEPLNLANESFPGGADGGDLAQAALIDPAAGAPPVAAQPEAGDGGASDRIAGLLAEGQQALDQGELQGAIDIWSRIFLIDIDNGEASRRIEGARQQKAEAERQADEVFHDGIAKIDSGELEGAAASFRRVLELQPGHAMASEYLEQIESGQTPSRSSPLVAEGLDVPDPGDAPMVDSEGTPSLEAAVERDRMVAVKGTDRRLMLIGALVFLVVVVGGFLLYRSRDALFPNATGEQEAPAAVSATIRRATALFERGKTDIAIELLEGIGADDSAHAQAQALLTQYRAAAEPVDAPAADTDTSLSPQVQARRAVFVDAARDALSAGHNIRARRYLVRADAIADLEGDELSLSESIEANLGPVADELGAFEDAEWERVLPRLWRKHDEDPGNPDLRLLIADSYYNLALRSLQRGTPADAAALLQSALEVEPNNETVQRMLGFAETYRTRPQDLLYRIYVKYLPSRT